MSIITAAATIACAACAFLGIAEGALILAVGGMLALTALSLCLMLHYRRKVARIKKAEGWQAVAQEHVAVALEGDMPHPISLAWSWIYAAIMLVTLLIGIAGYPSMPDMVPMHTDLAGNIDRWEPKSPSVILFPVLVQAFIAAAVMFSHWGILRSKKGTDPEMPVASALGYALFARAQSVFVVATGALVCAAMSLFTFSSMRVITMGQAGAALFIIIVPILVGSIALAVAYGQSGARAIKRVAQAAELRFDDDACWKLGILYWNAEDASLFVPARFGIGWTLNFARPSAWALVIGGLLVTTAFVVAISAVS